MATFLFSSKIAATSTLVHSPTAPASLGCYAEGGYYPVIVSPAGGDSALTIPGCKNTCYLRYYGFAAVKEGNQCWCSQYVSGELMDNQEDCNIPCAGDKKTYCGGKGVLSFFKTEEKVEPLSVTTSSATISSATISSATISSATIYSATTSSVSSAVETILSPTQSSGAGSNRAMF
jgi:hypothetical protein